MEILDTAFAQMVKEHKSTIYTVCFYVLERFR